MHKKSKQQGLEDRSVLQVMMQHCEAKNSMELLEQPHREIHTHKQNTAHKAHCIGSRSWRAWFLFLSLNLVWNGRWRRRTDVSLPFFISNKIYLPLYLSSLNSQIFCILTGSCASFKEGRRAGACRRSLAISNMSLGFFSLLLLKMFVKQAESNLTLYY